MISILIIIEKLASSLALFGSPVLLDLFVDFFLGEDPVIVNVIGCLLRYDDLGVLGVPRRQELLHVEDGHLGHLLLLGTLLVLVLLFGVFVLAALLSAHVLLVLFDLVLLFLQEGLLGGLKLSRSVLVSLLLGLDRPC